MTIEQLRKVCLKSLNALWMRRLNDAITKSEYDYRDGSIRRLYQKKKAEQQ